MVGQNILNAKAVKFPPIGVVALASGQLSTAYEKLSREEKRKNLQKSGKSTEVNESEQAPIAWHLFGGETNLEIFIRLESGSRGYVRITRPDQEQKKRITVYVAFQIGEELIERSYAHDGNENYAGPRALAIERGQTAPAEIEALLTTCEEYARKLIQIHQV
jgi:curved DNA-binding protein CbpA